MQSQSNSMGIWLNSRRCPNAKRKALSTKSPPPPPFATTAVWHVASLPVGDNVSVEPDSLSHMHQLSAPAEAVKWRPRYRGPI